NLPLLVSRGPPINGMRAGNSCETGRGCFEVATGGRTLGPPRYDVEGARLAPLAPVPARRCPRLVRPGDPPGESRAPPPEPRDAQPSRDDGRPRAQSPSPGAARLLPTGG